MRDREIGRQRVDAIFDLVPLDEAVIIRVRVRVRNRIRTSVRVRVRLRARVRGVYACGGVLHMHVQAQG